MSRCDRDPHHPAVPAAVGDRTTETRLCPSRLQPRDLGVRRAAGVRGAEERDKLLGRQVRKPLAHALSAAVGGLVNQAAEAFPGHDGQLDHTETFDALALLQPHPLDDGLDTVVRPRKPPAEPPGHRLLPAPDLVRRQGEGHQPHDCLSKMDTRRTR